MDRTRRCTRGSEGLAALATRVGITQESLTQDLNPRTRRERVRDIAVNSAPNELVLAGIEPGVPRSTSMVTVEQQTLYQVRIWIGCVGEFMPLCHLDGVQPHYLHTIACTCSPETLIQLIMDCVLSTHAHTFYTGTMWALLHLSDR